MTNQDPFDRNRPPAPTLEQASEEARPLVARPPDRFTVPLIVVGSVALGFIVYAFLSQGRQQVQVAAPPPAPPVVAVAAPPPPSPEIVAPPPPPAAPAPPRAAAVVPEGPSTDQIAAWKSPSLIVDLSGPTAAAPAPGTAPPQPGAPGAVLPLTQALAPPGTRPADTLSADERFAQRLGVGESNEPAQATRIADLGTTIPQGAVVTAVLETAINSDLPGYARAVVSREVRSFDGKKVLIPRGSHVIGQYRSGIALGQSRVFVVWTRLIRPDGASIEMASAGTDALGRGGLEGDVDSHFFARYGGAILLSLLGVAGDVLTDHNTQVVINSTQNVAGAAGSALQQEVNISPTIDVPAGTPLRIFVARDLDFAKVEAGP